MVDYARLAATAKRLIEANGRTVTLYRNGREVADASKPNRGPARTAATPLTPKAAFVPPRGTGFGFDLTLDPSLEESVDQVALIAADSVPGEDLETIDRLTDRLRPYQVVTVGRLQPGDRPVLFEIGVAS